MTTNQQTPKWIRVAPRIQLYYRVHLSAYGTGTFWWEARRGGNIIIDAKGPFKTRLDARANAQRFCHAQLKSEGYDYYPASDEWRKTPPKPEGEF